MRSVKSFVSLLLALMMIGVLAAPAYAEVQAAGNTVQVQIQNKSNEPVRLTLSGAATYRFDLGTGKTKVDVVPGKYNYSYQACGQMNTGKFNAQKGATLVLPKCGKEAGGEIKVTIKNKTGGIITIYLWGPKSYTFSFPSGTSKMSIVPGKYNFTIYGCGTSMSGTRNFKGGGNIWTFWCQ